MTKAQQLLTAVEGLLVRQFRVLQDLCRLTKEERQALSSNDVAGLLAQARCKEALMDRLGQLEVERNEYLRELAAKVGLSLEKAGPENLETVLASIDPDTAGRLLHLQEGILVLMGQLRDLTRGNQSLAASALYRADALQSFLVSLCHLPADHWKTLEPWSLADLPGQPLSQPDMILERMNELHQENHNALPAVFAAIISVRDALNNQDNAAASAALEDLQSALKNLGSLAEGEQQLQSHPGKDKWVSDMGLPSPTRETNLAEVIAGLYHQGTAYQAVLRANNRTLALA
jgi:flagellar biosynthesis/type III secretory pathway chaperone